MNNRKSKKITKLSEALKQNIKRRKISSKKKLNNDKCKKNSSFINS